MRTFIVFLCSQDLKDFIKNRADQLGLDVPEYLKYIAIKDIEEPERKK